MFVTYLTTYLGDKLPRFYIGSTGKKQSPEHVAKCVAARTGQKRTPEQIENIRRGALNRKHQPMPTDEHCEKLRQASLNAWKKRKES